MLSIRNLLSRKWFNHADKNTLMCIFLKKHSKKIKIMIDFD